MDLKSLIIEARTAYRKSGEKVTLPHREHVHTPGYVRLSALGNCALLHGFEKLGVEPDFPELTAEHDYRKAWLMDHGNYVAEMIQEALYWYMAKPEAKYGFSPELAISDDELKVVGRIDGILYDWEDTRKRHIIEIKDTEGIEKRSVGEPKLSYCLQALGYCMVTGISHASIVTVSKWGFNVYDLIPIEKGRYELRDENGYKYRGPSWMEDFNDPDTLSFARVKHEIEMLHANMMAVEGGYTVVPPIKDPLNHPQGWLCGRHAVKPTKTKQGVMYVNCPFAKRCHGWTKTSYNTEKTEDGKYAVVSDF